MFAELGDGAVECAFGDCHADGFVVDEAGERGGGGFAASQHFSSCLECAREENDMALGKARLYACSAFWFYDDDTGRGCQMRGEAIGHGVDIDEKVAAKHPYKQAYLPVARAEDGTLWSW